MDEGSPTGTVVFTASASGGSGQYNTYTFYLNGNSVQSGSNQLTETFTSTGTDSVYATVEDSMGYTSGNSNTVSVTVNSDPSVSISSSQNPTDVGKSVTFTSSVSGGTPGYTYSWSIDGSSYTSSSVTVSFPSSGTYLVQLSVTDAAGYTQTASLSETVNSAPTVTATSNVSSADIGSPIEFSSSPSGGTGPYTYSWVLNGNVVSTSQSFSNSFSSSGSYTLTLTVTDSVGDTTSSTVSVNINPNPSVTITSNQNPADAGDTVLFSSSVSGGTGTDTYVWYINGLEQSTSNGFSYTFSNSGSYYVNVTVTDSDGHKASYSLKEIVNPDPSVNINSSYNPVDVNQYVLFTANISGGTGPFSYNWSINGQRYTTSTVNYTFISSGTYAIQLTVTDKNGKVASSTLNEVVYPLPTVSISAAASPAEQDVNDTFFASVSGGVGPYNFSWTVNSIVISGGQKLVTHFNQTGTYTVNVTITDKFGNIAESSYSISVVPRPSSYVEGPANVDINYEAVWKAYASYGSGNYNYTWYFGTTPTDGTVNGYGIFYQKAIPAIGTYFLRLQVRDSNNQYANYTLNITVVDRPAVTTNESQALIDAGTIVTFASTIQNGVPFYNYTWTISGIGFVGYQSSLEYSFSFSGTYNVTVTVTDGDGIQASASIAIQVKAPPVAKILAEYSNIDPNVTDAFNVELTGGTGSLSYLWQVDGENVSHQAALNYSFSTAGTHTVELTVVDGVGSKSSYITDVNVVSYPQASIVYSANQTDANASVEFRASGNGGVGPYNYEWVIAGQTFYNSSLSYQFPSQGVYTVQLVVSDYFGKDASASTSISVYPDVSIQVNWTGTPTVSQTFPLQATVSGGLNPYSISWIFPSGEQQTGQNITHVFQSSGPRTFQVQVRDKTDFVVSRNFSIEVNLLVETYANATIGSGPLPVQFSASVLGGSGYAYNWTFGDGQYSLQEDPFHLFQVGNFTIRFTAISANGATGSEVINIVSLPPPVKLEFSPNANITTITNVEFRAVPNWDAGSNYTMDWLFPNGQSLIGLTINYTFPTYSSTNTVQGTFTYCHHTITEDLAVDMVPNPISLKWNVPNLLETGRIVNVSASATSTNAAQYTYQWSIGGQIFYGADQVLLFNNPGNYSVSVTVTSSLGNSKTLTETLQVENAGTSSSIVLEVTQIHSGPITTYEVHVVSPYHIVEVNAYLENQYFNLTHTNNTNGAWYNLTLNQGQYDVGTYAINIIAYASNGQSNSISVNFTVSSQYGIRQATIYSYFGGFTNFLIFVFVVIVAVGLLIMIALWHKNRNTEYVNLGGNVEVRGIKTPKFRRMRKLKEESEMKSDLGLGNRGGPGGFGGGGLP